MNLEFSRRQTLRGQPAAAKVRSPLVRPPLQDSNDSPTAAPTPALLKIREIFASHGFELAIHWCSSSTALSGRLVRPDRCRRGARRQVPDEREAAVYALANFLHLSPPSPPPNPDLNAGGELSKRQLL